MRRATSNLVELFRGHASSGKYVMVHDACGKMSMDVIAATSLGIDVGSFCMGGDEAERAKRGEFLKHVKDAFTMDIYKDPWMLLRFISGWVCDHLSDFSEQSTGQSSFDYAVWCPTWTRR